MAPRQNKKRKTAAGASSSGRFDNHRFLSRETQDLCESKTKNRAGIQERGIILDRECYPEICDEIERRHWVEYVAHPPPAAISLVREFYANATTNRERTSLVRGVQIRYDEETIARVLRVPIVNDAVYDGANNLDIDEVARVVYEKPVQWKVRNGVKAWFYARELPTAMRVWFHFICAKIIPTSHMTEVIRERAYILYAFTMRSNINLAHHIRINIENATRSSGVGLCFPHVITQLMMDAGVDISRAEMLRPRQPISIDTVNRMMRLAGEQPPPRPQPRHDTSDSEDTPSHHSRAAPPPQPQQPAMSEELLTTAAQQINQRLEHLEQQMNTRFQGMVEHHQRMEARIEQLFTYMDGQFRVMDIFLRSMANAAHFDVRQFPYRAPVPPPHQPAQPQMPQNSGRFPDDPPSPFKPTPDMQPFNPNTGDA